MDYGSGYPLHYNYLESSGTINNMYSRINSISDTPLTKEKNNDNNLRMFSTKQSLSVDNMLNQPKKETLARSLFRSASNLFIEGLTRGTSSLIRNLSNMNNPLSVTVVSQDFYKSLQQEKSQIVNPGFENIDISKSWMDDDESRTNDDTLSQILYSSDYSDKCGSSGDADKMWEKYKNMYIDPSKLNESNPMEKNEKISCEVNNSDIKSESFGSTLYIDDQQASLDTSTSFGTTLKIDGQILMMEEINNLDENQQSGRDKSETTVEESSKEQKFTSSTMNDFHSKSSKRRPVPSEADSSILFTKRACCSPRPRHVKKINMPGRRGDRAGSNLRRSKGGSKMKKSGAYYKRSRKIKRSKYDNSVDIKYDINNYEEFEYINDVSDDEEDNDDVKSVDVSEFKKEKSPIADEDDQQLKRTWWVAFSDRPIKKRSFPNLEKKSKEKLSVRPRLLSDSSDNSECSFSIEFVTECDSDQELEDDIDPDDSTSESESDDEDYVVFSNSVDMETDDKEAEIDSNKDILSVDCTDYVRSPRQIRPTRKFKVRFNDEPKVHHIVHWRYAYQAARLNDIQLDLDHFRADIPTRLVTIISPVLDEQHRRRIYLERFANQDLKD